MERNCYYPKYTLIPISVSGTYTSFISIALVPSPLSYMRMDLIYQGFNRIFFFFLNISLTLLIIKLESQKGKKTMASYFFPLETTAFNTSHVFSCAGIFWNQRKISHIFKLLLCKCFHVILM